MSLNAYITYLRQNCTELSGEEITLLQQGLQLRTLAPREPFLSVGEIPNYLAYVNKGLLKGVYTDSEGNRVNVNFFREGSAVCDYRGFRQRTESRYDFIAIEPTELVLISFDYFEKHTKNFPVLERHYRMMLEKALFAYVRRTERFLITDATARYQDFVQTDPDLFKRLSVSDLCSYLGIQRQTLTRIRKPLLEK